MQDEQVKLVIYVPETHANEVRKVLGEAGAGGKGNYKFCSFSVKGTGRFIPMKNAYPAIGKIGILEEVAEERIETICSKKDVKRIIEAVKKVHPYEVPAIDVYLLLQIQ